jgi:hypothetical protein
MSSGATPEEIVGLAFEAISDRDGDRLLPLLAPGVSIRTMRGSHEGADAVLAWIGKGYEHLDKRYVLEGLELEAAPAGGPMLGSAKVEYVWRESGEVGDSTPIFVVIELAAGLLLRLEFYESREEASAALDG